MVSIGEGVLVYTVSYLWRNMKDGRSSFDSINTNDEERASECALTCLSHVCGGKDFRRGTFRRSAEVRAEIDVASSVRQ